MKWISRDVKMRYKFYNNETRTIEKFLLFPKTIGGKTRWLEKVKIKQKIEENDPTDYFLYGWVDESWVD